MCQLWQITAYFVSRVWMWPKVKCVMDHLVRRAQAGTERLLNERVCPKIRQSFCSFSPSVYWNALQRLGCFLSRAIMRAVLICVAVMKDNFWMCISWLVPVGPLSAEPSLRPSASTMPIHEACVVWGTMMWLKCGRQSRRSCTCVYFKVVAFPCRAANFLLLHQSSVWLTWFP